MGAYGWETVVRVHVHLCMCMTEEGRGNGEERVRAEGEGGGVYLISCIDTIAIKHSTAEFSSSIPSQVVILDVRVPSIPVARLCNHRASINGITWAPHSSCHICTAGM